MSIKLLKAAFSQFSNCNTNIVQHADAIRLLLSTTTDQEKRIAALETGPKNPDNMALYQALHEAEEAIHIAMSMLQDLSQK